MKNKIPPFVFNIYHYFWSLLGALIYNFPSNEIKVIGVTGTNGKTTTIDLVAAVLEEEYKVAVLSSNQFRVGKEEKKNEMRMTMPGRGFIQGFLRNAVDSNCEFAIIEVTSEGVAQHRHRFIDFDVAALTNLSPEHIESHGSFENYRRAKGRLFKSVKGTHILNRDDDNFEYFQKFKAEEKITYSLDGIDVEADSLGIAFDFEGEHFELDLLGSFNAYNALVAIEIGKKYEIDNIPEALKKVKGVPGRMELVIKEPFSVIVDYAFTPNALEKVYSFVRSQISDSQMTCVLGACGGGRDKWKRPVLGELSSKYCDRVIVTNEDPYDEDPEEIIDDVLSGTENGEKVLSRREAIREALSGSSQGDVVIITGKGTEPSIVLANGERKPWDDRRIVREEFKRLYGD